ncbi:MAG: pyrroline-5-carboxylate reductase [Candidatus Omnitrophota bacterium]|nr:pyrroline-5-carboxylate reductase [Candidatus Omnitrophota bacterium]
MSRNLKIGIIGLGNMGSAIAQQLKAAYEIYVFDKDIEKTKNTSGMEVAAKIMDLVKVSDIIILAVKPQNFEAVLTEIKGDIKDKLVISIAAGITTGYIENFLGNCRVIRAMPNLLIKIGKGLTWLCKGKFATDNDLTLAQDIFNRFGKTLILEENMMHEATAVSGSSLGFHYVLLSAINEDDWDDYTKNTFIPRLRASAEAIGFGKQQSELLAKLIGEGDMALLKESKESPKTLCLQVTSKGGTTEAGLKKLKGNDKFLTKAIKAALKRAKELARIYSKA